tara:strand:- start:523 stop:822 length:300 start_codon:yes stop_codon:yes gene_type:complete
VEFGRHIGLKIRSFFKREGSTPSAPTKESSTNKEKEDMSTIKQVNQEVDNLKATVGSMSGRISRLVDELHVLRGEIKKFKSDVAQDITTLENMHNQKRK